MAIAAALFALVLAASSGAAQIAPPASEKAEERSCRIKGNVSADGERIYHLPGQRSYAATKVEPAKGERWFCSVEEARAAGWRPAGN